MENIYFYYFISTCTLVSSSFVTVDHPYRLNDYKMYDIEDNCEYKYSYTYELSKMNMSSAVKLEAYRDADITRTWFCNFIIKPPKGYGVILNMEDFQLGFSGLNNDCTFAYLQISGSGLASKKYCGSYPRSTSLYTIVGDMYFYYYGPFLMRNKGFTLVATAYMTGCSSFTPNLYKCANGKCIWDGLVKDGVNNCGDNSDEVKIIPTTKPTDSYINDLPASQGQSLIFIAVAIFFILLLITVFTVYNRSKRLSSTRASRSSRQTRYQFRNVPIHRDNAQIQSRNVEFSNMNFEAYNPNFETSEPTNVEQIHTPPPSYLNVVADFKTIGKEEAPPPYYFAVSSNANSDIKIKSQETTEPQGNFQRTSQDSQGTAASTPSAPPEYLN